MLRRLAQLFGCSAYKQSQRAANVLYQLAYKFLKEKFDALLANDHTGLAVEYGSLQDGEVSESAATAESNACKNRYLNVLPYDFNRVKISGEDDYINASIVQSPEGEEPGWKYIATQGPLPTTVLDFWKMVVESNCTVIIMLTRTIENNHIKCADYFARQQGETLRFGDYRVTTMEAQDVSQDVIKRTLQLKHHGTQEVHLVSHYHYHRWPDFNVPESTAPIRRLVRMLWDNGAHKSSMVVHCSAGIGRTGTLMAIDVILRRLWSMAEGGHTLPPPEAIRDAVDVPAVVSYLRRQRKGMVQSIEQYYFCYEALLQELQATLEEDGELSGHGGGSGSAAAATNGKQQPKQQAQQATQQ